MIKSPINWYGGKYYMSKKITNIFPKHKIFVEGFGGAGHIILQKESSEIEVYNDIHEGLYLLFKILRDEEKSHKLIKQLQLTPYSRQEFLNCKDWIDDENDIEKVRKFYILTMQSVGSAGKGWSYSKNLSRRGMSSTVSKWLGNIDKNMVDVIERLREIQIENLDILKLIKKYDNENTLFYLDPPYVKDSRVSKEAYKYEMDNEDHEKLIDSLLNIKGKVILSGYMNKIYKRLEDNGWKNVFLGDFSKKWHTKNGGFNKGKEHLWVNYEINKN